MAKLSISLDAADVALLDERVSAGRAASRSAAVQQAVELLRRETLGGQYAEAWEEWERSGEQSVWDAASADGLRR